MTETENRATVRRALDLIKPYLAAYIAQVLGSGASSRGLDVSALLGTMIERWDRDFASRLPRSARAYVHELRDVRNRWAHEEPFDDDETRRAVDTARLLAKAIGAPAEQLALSTDGSRAPAARASRPVAGRTPSQRDVMRDIFARFSDHERIIREYAAAERRGQVARRRNKSGVSPEEYARLLLLDGLKKGWLEA